MITPEQVPEDVWVEVALRLESVGCLIPNSVAKLIVAEAINAWPGAEQWQRCVECKTGPHLTLPLPHGA